MINLVIGKIFPEQDIFTSEYEEDLYFCEAEQKQAGMMLNY